MDQILWMARERCDRKEENEAQRSSLINAANCREEKKAQGSSSGCRRKEENKEAWLKYV